MTDVSAARQRAERVLNAKEWPPHGNPMRGYEAAEALARDVIAAEKEVESYKETLEIVEDGTGLSIIAAERDEFEACAVAAEERAAELEKAARRVVDGWEVFRMGSVGWAPIYEPLVALRAALSSSASPDTEAT